MSIQSIIWAWRVLWSRSFIVADEKQAVCHINIRDPETFDSIMMLSAQYTSLSQFIEELERVKKEHEQISKNLFGKNVSNLNK